MDDAATGGERRLLSECYAVVGDGAETATLISINCAGAIGSVSLVEWVEQRILPLRNLDLPGTTASSHRLGCASSRGGKRFHAAELLTGEVRSASRKRSGRGAGQRGIAAATTVAARLMGEWAPMPTGTRLIALKSPTTICRGRSRFAWPRRSKAP